MSAHADADMPMPDGCDLCGDEGGRMSAAVCFANCAAAAAILVTVMPSAIESGWTAVVRAEPAVAERHRPPDPDPPKSIAKS